MQSSDADVVIVVLGAVDVHELCLIIEARCDEDGMGTTAKKMTMNLMTKKMAICKNTRQFRLIMTLSELNSIGMMPMLLMTLKQKKMMTMLVLMLVLMLMMMMMMMVPMLAMKMFMWMMMRQG